jgi:hypothetical protein
LEELGGLLDKSATTVLRKLDRCLYAGEDHSWDGFAAWQALGPALANAATELRKRRDTSPELPPLYPQRA